MILLVHLWCYSSPASRPLMCHPAEWNYWSMFAGGRDAQMIAFWWRLLMSLADPQFPRVAPAPERGINLLFGHFLPKMHITEKILAGGESHAPSPGSANECSEKFVKENKVTLSLKKDKLQTGHNYLKCFRSRRFCPIWVKPKYGQWPTLCPLKRPLKGNHFQI